mgnify:CR=1 FL=1
MPFIASAALWAATEARCANQAYNITNGDYFRWLDIWPRLAAVFGMEVGEDRPFSLAAGLPERSADWARVVAHHGLDAPNDLGEFVGQSFIYADVILGYGMTGPLPPAFVSTVKIRRAGFVECMDTEDMFRSWIARLQQRRLLPPR